MNRCAKSGARFRGTLQAGSSRGAVSRKTVTVLAAFAIAVLAILAVWRALSQSNKRTDMKPGPAPAETTAVAQAVAPQPVPSDTAAPKAQKAAVVREKAAKRPVMATPPPAEAITGAPIAAEVAPDTAAERLAAEEKRKADEENARREQERLEEEKRIRAEQEHQEQLRLQEERKKKYADMVWIPDGTFMMGSKDGNPNEAPAHQVTLTGFYMDKYEVTQEHFERVMGFNPSHFRECPQCPVENVSWQEAMEYCRKMGAWLPTEAQWEYAARAGKNARYYWGRDMDGDFAWYSGNSGNKTHPVGQKRPNARGLYDMSGNVWEWCSDWYGEYDSSATTDPAGPAEGAYRVLRGGSWISPEGYLRSTVRYTDPAPRRNAYGFRCCRR